MDFFSSAPRFPIRGANMTCSHWAEVENSARIVTHGERDGQADAEPMLDELDRLVDEGCVSLRHGRGWQHDHMHEQVNEGAISEAAKDGVTDQNCESATGQIVDRCRAEGDDEMQDDSQRRGACASAIRLQAEDTAGNGLRNEDRFLGTVNQDRVSQVQCADDQTADGDGRKRAWLDEGCSCKTVAYRGRHSESPIRISCSRGALHDDLRGSNRTNEAPGYCGPAEI